MPTDWLLEEEVENHGFAVRENILSAAEVSWLLDALSRADGTESMRVRGGVFAIRNLLNVSQEIQTFARSAPMAALIEPPLERAVPC